ncbi:hypothetical protein MC7420_7260 [Coleofasciculus chthonoplastes PCC 7420]|uniref:Uncharacterized protein n=1 Tax=Coleofasciculus chthonoplastes PCC 7420 TaxID=118168 RepID=B4VHD9_9CYAN|nr:hypothetical protein MC7420_7260 [Coleofasciculus chthonoplastes PCC 7420]
MFPTNSFKAQLIKQTIKPGIKRNHPMQEEAIEIAATQTKSACAD